MHKENICIWGREFNLELYYKGSREAKPSPRQESAFALLRDAKVEMERSNQGVKEYIRHDCPEQIGSGDIENLFRYVMPA